MRARLTLEAGDCVPTTIDLSPTGQPVTLGRSRDNTIVLRDELASRTHAKIYFEDGSWHVRDFGLNGTRVEGNRVNGSLELRDGQRVKIGDVVLKFVLEPKAPPRPVKEAPPTMPNKALHSENLHNATKVHEIPAERLAPGQAPPTEELDDNQLRVDELTALCKFMSGAVEHKTPH